MARALLASAPSLQLQADALRKNSSAGLAPWFAAASTAAIAECNAEGVDVVSFECCRGDALARIYFQEGVSKAPTAHLTWHWDAYGLARDVISKSRGWNVYPDAHGNGGDAAWVATVCRVFKAHGLAWGGDWHHFRDWPHWYPAALPATPTSEDIALAVQSGPFAVALKYGLTLAEPTV